jgi:hypothetical protein
VSGKGPEIAELAEDARSYTGIFDYLVYGVESIGGEGVVSKDH